MGRHPGPDITARDTTIKEQSELLELRTMCCDLRKDLEVQGIRTGTGINDRIYPKIEFLEVGHSFQPSS